MRIATLQKEIQSLKISNQVCLMFIVQIQKISNQVCLILHVLKKNQKSFEIKNCSDIYQMILQILGYFRVSQLDLWSFTNISCKSMCYKRIKFLHDATCSMSI